MTLVVVGAGLAAATAITTLRENGYAEPITLIGDEDELPYERPALSKDYLQGKGSADQLYVHDAGWYDGVDLRLADRAVAIDRDARTVRLASGAEVPYGHLLLATGARPRSLGIPGAERAHTLRTRADSDRLRDALAAAERWVVIGAGWIGLEVAAAARTAGHPVTVLEYAPLPLQRVLGDGLARHFADLHRRNEVDLRLGAAVRSVEDGGVRVDGELVPADAVVMAVGVAPNTELAAAAGLAVDNGIVVDERLRTADPRVLAAGDVAAAGHATLGRLRVEHWDNAIRQGRLAAATILDRPGTYDWQPYFYTDQYDLGMEYVGHHDPADRLVLRGDPAGGEFIAFWLAGDAVTAAMNVNVWDVNDTLRGLVGRPADPARLADPAVPLTDL
ncbi:MAG TPA: FAD-dependent oxidoreductase [Mycobacteriales bacterium]|nr:FAD-dependent oxidoreductase [Mycobacteriales bacterium]